MVTTNHGPFTPEMIAHFGAFAERVPVIAISESQRRSAPGLPVAAIIHHGADVADFELGDDIVYVGQVGQVGQVGERRRAELLAGALALVNPVRWPEPFGLVMIEALACGTPAWPSPKGRSPRSSNTGAPASSAVTRPTWPAGSPRRPG